MPEISSKYAMNMHLKKIIYATYMQKVCNSHCILYARKCKNMHAAYITYNSFVAYICTPHFADTNITLWHIQGLIPLIEAEANSVG
jgi:hypothetical protein